MEGVTWEYCSSAVPSFSVQCSRSCEEPLVVPIVISCFVNFSISGKNNQVKNIEWITKRKGVEVWEYGRIKIMEEKKKNKRRKRRGRRVEISVLRVWNYVRIERFNFQNSFNMVWIMVFMFSSFFTLGPGSWHIFLHIFLLFRTPKGCWVVPFITNSLTFAILVFHFAFLLSQICPLCLSILYTHTPHPPKLHSYCQSGWVTTTKIKFSQQVGKTAYFMDEQCKKT